MDTKTAIQQKLVIELELENVRVPGDRLKFIIFKAKQGCYLDEDHEEPTPYAQLKADLEVAGQEFASFVERLNGDEFLMPIVQPSSTDRLVAALQVENVKAGNDRLARLIKNAKANVYHEFKSPSPTPFWHLITDLQKLSQYPGEFHSLLVRIAEGEFKCGEDESLEILQDGLAKGLQELNSSQDM